MNESNPKLIPLSSCEVTYLGRTVVRESAAKTRTQTFYVYESNLTNFCTQQHHFLKPQLPRQRVGDQFAIETNDEGYLQFNFATKIGRAPDKLCALLAMRERVSLSRLQKPKPKPSRDALTNYLSDIRQEYRFANSQQKVLILSNLIEAITS